MMRTGTSAHVLLACATMAAATACQDAAAPTTPVPASPRLAGQPLKDGWNVTTVDDPRTGSCTSAQCTLRDAVAAAQDGDKIVFKSGVSGTIALTHTLSFSKNVTVNGAGRITLDAQTVDNGPDGDNRVAFVTAQNVELIGLTLTHGSAGTDDFGGGIVNLGGLTLTNSIVTGNHTLSGGGAGIYNSGTLKIVGSTIADNHGGGGAGILSSGTLTVLSSTISGNSTTEPGGGIYAFGGTVTVTASTISGNFGKDGAGIYVVGSATSVPLITLVSATITNNVGDFLSAGYGGIRVVTGQVQARNTILAGNFVNSSGIQPAVDCLGPTGAFVSFGYNISSSACFGQTSDVNVSLAQVFTEVLDRTLQDHGGPTKTHALIERGLAVDAGYCPGENTDQRGFVRPYDDTRLSNAGDACDIGAFEWQPPGTKRSK